MKDFIQPKLFEIISAEILKYQDFHRKDFAWTEGLTISIISKIVEGQNILGMVPEDECVRLPKVEKWPEWAAGLRLVFEDGTPWDFDVNGFDKPNSSKMKTFSFIHRPTPAWTPKVGEAVFCRQPNTGMVSFGVVKALPVDGKWYRIRFPDGHYGEWSIDYMKPGSLDQIGKPWDEIPNA